MKAVVCTRYGAPEVLHIQEVPKPVPKGNEILIRVHATPVTFGEITARNFSAVTPRKFTMPLLLWLPVRMMFGFRRPKRQILGSEFSGVIEEVGKGAKRFKPGDPVFGYRGMRFGANAEYLCMPEDGCVAIKPANMTYEEACAVPGGAITALSLLRRVTIQRGQKVLINGASGGIGSRALQLAKYYGAQVTGMCGTPRVELVKSLGADDVIDYTEEDFTERGDTYDLIFDILGKSSFSRCKRSLNKDGVYLLASFKMRQLLQMLWTLVLGGKRVICALASEKTEDLIFVKELIEAGKMKSIVDRSYPMEQAAEAHRYVEKGHKKGNVVITMGHIEEAAV